MSTGIGAVGHCTGKEVVTCGSQEVPLQDRPEALGVCAEVAADQGLRGALGVVEGPALGTDARPSVPGDVGHGKTILRPGKHHQRARNTQGEQEGQAWNKLC